MAGLGRKVFAAGEVLTAANVQGYLQDQAVMVFDEPGSVSRIGVISAFKAFLAEFCVVREVVCV